MSERLRSHVRMMRRDRGGSPLLELQQLVNANAPGPPGLPAAATRAAVSWYADLARPAGGVRVCRGTSCALAGADSIEDTLHERGCEPVYCLGFCDRSPVVLRPDGTPLIECRAETVAEAIGGSAPGPPDIRCAAPEPIVTRRIGRGDFADIDTARADGAYDVLRQVVDQTPDDVVSAMETSGERGRGGAAFPTGAKWRACARSPGERKYAIANGDEGDPGSFIDRVLMERDPHGVLEGLAICAFACGATDGIAFIRSEYPAAIERMSAAITAARKAGILGPSVMGTGFSFDVTVFPGLGSYVCGEETAMLNAIEGFRGEVRLRPPYPTEQGLYGLPTVVNNVETLVNVPWIIGHGVDAYTALGTTASSGTKAMCLNHGFARPGIVEVELGTNLGALINDLAGGARDDGRIDAVILGGPMGSVLTPDEWQLPICYAAMAQRDVQLGHGGLVALPEGTDYAALLEHWLAFMQDESCGKCVPCSLGSRRALDLAIDLRADGRRETVGRLLEVMAQASLCAFGREMPRPMRRLLELTAEATR